jgi:hypothetical protein
MNRDDLFPPRTAQERAKEYLHRRSLRPQAPPQTEGLFPEPEHQARRFVPLGQPIQQTLFPEPEHQEQRLLPVDGWPDYRAG